MMELKLSGNFYELSEAEVYEVAGGDVVESFVSGVLGIWDSWCDMWYEAGQHAYNWFN